MSRAFGDRSSATKRSGFGAFGSASSSSDQLSYLAQPPDLSSISDPNLIVSFKNLLKKDSTTKSKALEDLVAYAQNHPYEGGGAEESVLDAWVQVYPRISIDNSRRVRELAHSFQFELMKSARKRMEKRLINVVGSWLAGVYDRERVVSRIADDGLSSFLNTPEKLLQFWRRCQSQILDFAQGAIQETAGTLSDERSTTPEDSEAKYFRVINAALSLVVGLLQRLSDEDATKQSDSLDSFFAQDAVWKSLASSDSAVRKSSYQLLWLCIERRPTMISSQKSKLKKILISEALKTNQTGSAEQFVRVLTRLTDFLPDIWKKSSSTGSEKTTPLRRLGIFIEKGSQGGPVTFWGYLEKLLLSIPTDLIGSGAAVELLSSLRLGIASRDEPRNRSTPAWECYLHVVSHFIQSAPSTEHKVRLSQESLLPLITNYLNPGSAKSGWSSASQIDTSLLCNAHEILSSMDDTATAASTGLQSLSAEFCTRISNSLPAVSSEFEKSQEAIGEEARRWFSLIGAIQKRRATDGRSISNILDGPAESVVARCISHLQNRNYKPFGSAQALKHMALLTRYLQDPNGHLLKLQDFLTAAAEDIALVLDSRSTPEIVACIQAIASYPEHKAIYTEIWASWIEALLESTEEPHSASTIATLLSNNAVSTLAQNNVKLQEYLTSRSLSCAKSTAGDWDLFEVATKYNAFALSSCKAIANGVIDYIPAEGEELQSALRALRLLTSHMGQSLSQDEDLHAALVTKILSLTEISEGTVSSEVSASWSVMDPKLTSSTPVISIVQENLENPGPQSLEVDTLVTLALGSANSGAKNLEDLVPNTHIWLTEMAKAAVIGMNASLSVASSLVGAQFIVDWRVGSTQSAVLRRDRNGYSTALRMALYVTQLLDSDAIDFSSLAPELQVECLLLLCLAVEKVSDELVLGGRGGLFLNPSSARDQEKAVMFVSTSREIINAMVKSTRQWPRIITEPDADTTILERLLALLLSRAKERDPLGFYSSRALNSLVQALVAQHGVSQDIDGWLAQTEVLKGSPATALPAVALLTAFGETLETSKVINTLSNRLVSEVPAAKLDSEKTVPTLVALSACLNVFGLGELPVAMNRAVFAVRHITNWFDEPEELDPIIAAEACRCLQKLLPAIKDVYGAHWGKTVEFCTFVWSHASKLPTGTNLPVIHASLKLISTLESLSEPNDDLEEALKEHDEARALGLIDLLYLSQDHVSLPEEVVDTLLHRQVRKIPLRHIKDISDIYGILSSESREIQTAGFELLHRAIPAAQEQISIDALLDSKTVSLPVELLSLLLEPPTLEKYPDEALSQFPVAIRSYLLAWCLVFDAYSTASLGVRSDYTEGLKTEDYVSPLLDFLFDVLGHSAAHPFDLDKDGFTSDSIRNYDLDAADSETPERALHWLLIHIHYLCLKYVPELFRAWYFACRSKQTLQAVEPWEAKYFSPLIVSDSLDDVAAWASSQDPPADDEKELVVKVSRPAREVTASYEVDELHASIVVKIPPNYPIDAISVVGTNRVVVNEKTWQSWVRTTQGVITLSNGSIVDGLLTFRRNIVGALKGQTECAICYAIISSDKKMPDKRCQTCKNLFHRTCLYKWFQTSNQNSCPLCRNPIDFLGAPRKK